MLSRSFRPASNLRLVRGFAASANEATITFHRPFKGHKLDPPESKCVTNKEELLGFYRTLAYYRRFEIVADTLYKERQIRGFCHLYDGQEAIAVGMEAAITKSDSVITAYRDHCHQLGRGDTGGSVMAELMGKATGCSAGKGGSMHMYLPSANFFGGNGIVGAQVPVGVGLAFKHKYLKDGGVSLSFFGDGAANQGQIFEAANMAALWKLPAIFVCENNEYGMGTAAHRAAASTNYYTRGDYVPGIWVDGMDVLAAKTGFKFAADWCRAGKGPIFVEMSTYRYHGHSMSDPGIAYRSRDEVSNVRATRDCIDSTKKRLLELKWADEAALKAIDKEVRAKVDEDVKFAQNSPQPELKELFTHVYTGAPPPFIRAKNFYKSIENAS